MAAVAVLGCAGCLAASAAALGALSTLSPEEIVYGRELAKRYPSPGSVGELQSSAGVEMTVLRVDGGVLPHGPAGSANQFVEALISVKNVELQALTIDRNEFRLTERDGASWRPLPPDSEKSLRSGTLARGDLIAGWLRYEIPVLARGLRLHLELSNSPPGYQTLRVDLGR
jgi:hypothetical protein